MKTWQILVMALCAAAVLALGAFAVAMLSPGSGPVWLTGTSQVGLPPAPALTADPTSSPAAARPSPTPEPAATARPGAFSAPSAGYSLYLPVIVP